MFHFLPHKLQIAYALIAVASGGLAAWLAVTARVKAALMSAAHARTAYRMVNGKYMDAVREISRLRREVARLTAQNEKLSGRPSIMSAVEEDRWEAGQRQFEEAAAQIDASEKATAVAVGASPVPGSKKAKAEAAASRAASAIAEAAAAVSPPDEAVQPRQGLGRFLFRPKPVKEGYRDNTRDSREEL